MSGDFFRKWGVFVLGFEWGVPFVVGVWGVGV